MARVAEIIAPRFPDASADELRVDRVRLAGPPRRAPRAAAGAPRPAGRARPRLTARGAQQGDGVPGRPARRAPRGRPVATGAEGGALRPPPRGRTPRCRRHRPGRGPRPLHPHLAAVPARADRSLTVQAGARPLRPGPHHRLRAPRVAQGTGPPGHRRRLLALRHLHRTGTSTTTTRSPTTLTRTSGAAHRVRPAPTTPDPSVGDITATRPTPATAPDNAAPGRYVWLTPHGLGFIVDARGTRRISSEARPDDPRRPTRRRHLPGLSWSGARPGDWSRPQVVGRHPQVPPVRDSEARGRDELEDVSARDYQQVLQNSVRERDLVVTVVPRQLGEVDQVKGNSGVVAELSLEIARGAPRVVPPARLPPSRQTIGDRGSVGLVGHAATSPARATPPRCGRSAPRVESLPWPG